MRSVVVGRGALDDEHLVTRRNVVEQEAARVVAARLGQLRLAERPRRRARLDRARLEQGPARDRRGAAKLRGGSAPSAPVENASAPPTGCALAGASLLPCGGPTAGS